MKLLIGYDGSNSAAAALDGLSRAGLPQTAKALLLAVAELGPQSRPTNNFVNEYFDEKSHSVNRHYERNRKSPTTAKKIAEDARERLKKNFPNWKIETKTSSGSSAPEILSHADNFGADLIVLAAHERTAFNRRALGEISNDILNESNCSVRIVRSKININEASRNESPRPERIVIGFDDSMESLAAVHTVASRQWPKGSEVRLIARTNTCIPTDIGRFVPPIVNWTALENQTKRQLIPKLAEKAKEYLNERGLSATVQYCTGNPRLVLIEEAEKWNSDSIFVGAKAFKVDEQFKQFPFGSVSSAVAARAHCSVEVVKTTSRE